MGPMQKSIEPKGLGCAHDPRRFFFRIIILIFAVVLFLVLVIICMNSKHLGCMHFLKVQKNLHSRHESEMAFSIHYIVASHHLKKMYLCNVEWCFIGNAFISCRTSCHRPRNSLTRRKVRNLNKNT